MSVTASQQQLAKKIVGTLSMVGVTPVTLS